MFSVLQEYDSFMNDLLGDGSSSGRPVGLIEGAGGADAGALVLSTSSGGTDIDALLKAQGPSVAGSILTLLCFLLSAELLSLFSCLLFRF